MICVPKRKSRKSDTAANQLRPAMDEVRFIGNDSFQSLRLDTAAIESMVNCQPETPKNGRVSMPAHLECMCNTPLLTPAQERDLFQAMNFLKYRADMLRSGAKSARQSKKKLKEAQAALEMSRKVRNRIISSNVRLVVSIVKKYSDSDCTFDDLLSEGISCLMNAVEKFDYDRGFRFSTYATSAIRRDLFRLVQRRHRDKSRFATGTTEVLEGSLGDECDPNRTQAALETIDAGIAKLIKTLDEREQFIVSARYGFIDLGEKPTFQRLGRELGVSKERVRQLEIRAVAKLQRLALQTSLKSFR